MMMGFVRKPQGNPYCRAQKSNGVRRTSLESSSLEEEEEEEEEEEDDKMEK